MLTAALSRVPRHPAIKLLLSVGFVQGLLVLSGPLAVRLLGIGGRGELALVLAVLGMTGTVAVAGIPSAVVYFSGSMGIEPLRIVEVLWIRLLVVFGVTAACSVVVLVCIDQLSEPLTSPVWETGLTIVGGGVVVAAQIGLACLQAVRRFDVLPWVQILPGVIYVIWLATLLIATFPSVTAAATGFITAWAAVIVCCGVTLRNSVSRPGRSEVLDKAQIVTFTRRAMIAGVAPTDQSRLDQILVGLLLGHTGLGLYAIAFAFETATVMPSTALAQFVATQVAHAVPDDRRRLATRWTLQALLLTGLLALVLQPLIRPVMELAFGREALPAVPAARLLVLAGVFLGLRRLLAVCLQSMGRPRASTAAESISFILMVVGVVLGAQFWGVTGSCMGLLAGGISGASLLLLVLLARGAERHEKVDPNGSRLHKGPQKWPSTPTGPVMPP